MMLLRIKDLPGKYITLEGGQKLVAKYKYGQSDAGWFPIDSLQFGFNGQTESSAGGNGGGSGNSNGSGGSGGGSGNSSQSSSSSGSGGSKSEEDFTQLSISKHVDAATTHLMGYAMEDRKVTKADEDKLRKADIHFIDSVRMNTSGTDQFIFPYLMITLDRVLIKGWEISSQGDDRPTESLTLWYDRCAMRYFRTSDGKVWTSVEPKGWDQQANEPWVPSDGEAPYFKQPDH